MPRPRQTLVSLEDTPYYHCVARCVRRAFLCGYDRFSDKSFEHRKQWVVDRLRELSASFAVDVCAYAVMSNHYHVVVRIDAERAKAWSDQEVAERWGRLFSGQPMLVSRYLAEADMGTAEQAVAVEMISTWRTRLMDLSWFMRCLNEHLARRANAEDGCTGRFWEGRFKSQALLTEAGLLTCMAYVDLNPVRAGLAATPEDSDFTSIQARIRAHEQGERCGTGEAQGESRKATLPLLIMADSEHADRPARSIPFGYEAYLQLVDWSGRAVRNDKRGAIDAALPPILDRLGIEPEHYLKSLRTCGCGFVNAVGPAAALRDMAKRLGLRSLKGVVQAAGVFPALAPH